MPLWGKADAANNAPKYKILPNSTANGSVLFGTQVVGLSDAEVQANGNICHTGWTRVQRGTGPVSTVTITAGGTGYANGEVVRIVGGTANSTFTVGTNGSGVITSVTKVKAGSGFVNNSTITTTVRVTESGAASAGTGATFSVVLGGRANRVQTETLVALSGMTGNNSIV